MSKFIVGDRVILSGQNYYRDKPNNPVWGGQYGHIVGTIILIKRDGIYIGGTWINVEWDNETQNGYPQISLNFAPAERIDDPNFAFGRRKHGRL